MVVATAIQMAVAIRQMKALPELSLFLVGLILNQLLVMPPEHLFLVLSPSLIKTLVLPCVRLLKVLNRIPAILILLLTVPSHFLGI
ncbi:hypothetical protein BTN33_00900 [Aeromonas veronii]|nr:hypothetical protein BTN33_00900 [Aeromonas veronii]